MLPDILGKRINVGDIACVSKNRSYINFQAGVIRVGSDIGIVSKINGHGDPEVVPGIIGHWYTYGTVSVVIPTIDIQRMEDNVYQCRVKICKRTADPEKVVVLSPDWRFGFNQICIERGWHLPPESIQSAIRGREYINNVLIPYLQTQVLSAEFNHTKFKLPKELCMTF